MKGKAIQVPTLSIYVSAAEILQRRMDVRGPGPGSPEACRVKGDDIPASVSLAWGLAKALPQALADRGELFQQMTPIQATMAAATRVLVMTCDMQEGGEIWDNEHARKYHYAHSIGVALSLFAQVLAVAEVGQTAVQS